MWLWNNHDYIPRVNNAQKQLPSSSCLTESLPLCSSRVALCVWTYEWSIVLAQAFRTTQIWTMVWVPDCCCCRLTYCEVYPPLEVHTMLRTSQAQTLILVNVIVLRISTNVASGVKEGCVGGSSCYKFQLRSGQAMGDQNVQGFADSVSLRGISQDLWMPFSLYLKSECVVPA